ncbi:MAG: hypothetical protein EXQ93_03190 [Alphaproteobacteria bacterium]|nr:hypothetical protein [Alphaproteobacteria bacterium]
MASADSKARNVAILAAGLGMVGFLTSMAVILPRIDPTYVLAEQAAQDTSPFVPLDQNRSPPHPLSIALLPMATEPGADVPEPFMAEFTRSVKEELSGLGLRVADERAALLMRDEKAPAHEQGRTLGVRYVLAATLAGAEDDIRVHATLTDCSTKRVLWKGTFWQNRGFSGETADRELVVALRTVLPLDFREKHPEEW